MSKKPERTIAATTHIDSHGDQLSLEALQQMCDIMNGPRKIRYSVEHNREFPPIGQGLNGEIIEKDGYYYLTQEMYEFTIRKEAEWDNTLIIETFENPNPFVEVKHELPEVTEIFIDPNNFLTTNHYNSFVSEIADLDFDFKIRSHFRKSILNDPEIIFNIGGAVTSGKLIYDFLKPFFKTTGEKLADAASDEVVKATKKFLKFVSKSIKATANRYIPLDRPLTVVFEIHTDIDIELIAKSRDNEFITKCLTEKKLSIVQEKIENLSKYIDIDKVQFKLSEKGKWEFTYLLTKEGESIGTKTVIKKRDRKLELTKSGYIPKKYKKLNNN